MKKELANYLNKEAEELKSRQRFERLAKKRFIKLLNKTLTACYEAGMENNGAVLILNIKDLYRHQTGRNFPFSKPHKCYFDKNTEKCECGKTSVD